jgi:hydroxypyruvate isomerase
MPDFAANLSTMFTDLPFLERFDAAARCGFDAVDLAFPYAYPKEEVAKRLHERHLTLVAFNLPAGRVGRGRARHRVPPRPNGGVPRGRLRGD